MKKRGRSLPLIMDGDSQAMRDAVHWAQGHHLEILRPSRISYWIEGYLFWPNAGTIQKAGNEKALRERGLAGLARTLGRAP